MSWGGTNGGDAWGGAPKTAGMDEYGSGVANGYDGGATNEFNGGYVGGDGSGVQGGGGGGGFACFRCGQEG
jgi:hypothetical protein